MGTIQNFTTNKVVTALPQLSMLLKELSDNVIDASSFKTPSESEKEIQFTANPIMASLVIDQSCSDEKMDKYQI